jgi:hypothetical protein
LTQNAGTVLIKSEEIEVTWQQIAIWFSCLGSGSALGHKTNIAAIEAHRVLS